MEYSTVFTDQDRVRKVIKGIFADYSGYNTSDEAESYFLYAFFQDLSTHLYYVLEGSISGFCVRGSYIYFHNAFRIKLNVFLYHFAEKKRGNKFKD